MATTHFGSRHIAGRVGAAVAEFWRRASDAVPVRPEHPEDDAPVRPAVPPTEGDAAVRPAVPPTEDDDAPVGPAVPLPEGATAVRSAVPLPEEPAPAPPGDEAAPPADASAPESSDEPGLPVVTFDDGRRLTLDRALVLGRDPVAEPGKLSVRIDDPDRSVSKTHCAVAGLADGTAWVADRFSANGTCVIDAAGTVHACPPGEVVEIPPGATVHIGGRSFTVAGDR
jgi:hypothetical protein